ncbi:redoxin domain-containing protein [Sphingomonas sp. G-3-2-10]|uniref:redoxin domain-containing protein n=1 Tax=Sphingomonas sp. G-3-2-10 TaxID=2728838 RepID=UPI00146DE628|nr:redoxin domain-containing protein [Sphingomonas sp. G-3-2-10]NML06473.1 redoxin domain-containing protein [Sphingomonas sp. G-3-2-10]
MSKWILTGAAAAAAFLTGASAPLAEPAIGAPATNFKARDANGNIVELAGFRGKTVVLEWHNPRCPFVKKHYNSGNMQKTQAAAAAQGVVWLTINSGAEGQQGHMKGPEALQFVSGAKAKPAAYLLDPAGLVGKAYGAKTTPHMYIISPAGKLVYRGGIDDKPTADTADIASARNHVSAALAEIRAGKPVSVAETRPYGCSVKYAG